MASVGGGRAIASQLAITKAMSTLHSRLILNGGGNNNNNNAIDVSLSNSTSYSASATVNGNDIGNDNGQRRKRVCPFGWLGAGPGAGPEADEQFDVFWCEAQKLLVLIQCTYHCAYYVITTIASFVADLVFSQYRSVGRCCTDAIVIAYADTDIMCAHKQGRCQCPSIHPSIHPMPTSTTTMNEVPF